MHGKAIEKLKIIWARYRKRFLVVQFFIPKSHLKNIHSESLNCQVQNGQTCLIN